MFRLDLPPFDSWCKPGREYLNMLHSLWLMTRLSQPIRALSLSQSEAEAFAHEVSFLQIYQLKTGFSVKCNWDMQV